MRREIEQLNQSLVEEVTARGRQNGDGDQAADDSLPRLAGADARRELHLAEQFAGEKCADVGRPDDGQHEQQFFRPHSIQRDQRDE